MLSYRLGLLAPSPQAQNVFGKQLISVKLVILPVQKINSWVKYEGTGNSAARLFFRFTLLHWSLDWRGF